MKLSITSLPTEVLKQIADFTHSSRLSLTCKRFWSEFGSRFCLVDRKNKTNCDLFTWLSTCPNIKNLRLLDCCPHRTPMQEFPGGTGPLDSTGTWGNSMPSPAGNKPTLVLHLLRNPGCLAPASGRPPPR
eukprot:TRINITY_DN64485_c0_g2_i3.p1 TRINITY_DN64485_c0_g2~~TRINITY_DN64485_c0_g2_i3.p1  ORF type:complete len:130 (+),score=12.18 TRINITY_DN64485_c0_g2_i3:67-456(+)